MEFFFVFAILSSALWRFVSASNRKEYQEFAWVDESFFQIAVS
jgi:hypothetical protein